MHVRSQENIVLCQEDKKQQIVACYTNKLCKWQGCPNYLQTKRKKQQEISKNYARQKSRHQLRTNWLPNIFKPVTKSIAASYNALTSVKLKAVYLLEIDAT